MTHQVQFALQADKILALKDVSGSAYTLKGPKKLTGVGRCPLPLQGRVEAYGSQSELISQGVNPAHLLGLKREERDEFACKDVEDKEEEEEEEEGEEEGEQEEREEEGKGTYLFSRV